ncbi:BZ3500_MvSof-1268-A1-R1_Chr10-1g02532 [Microbotryum saponariae]|uniref:BZ3500_MvSof-1268-A1-R1_Chr10-1g02532 protein n=1 Tax=Microbotryum saponariae TaxID=289078 RepID=A0A2X0L970_9BASI|nr:BZ3500_MvSof-1268-A1-R1_Chr10-1g02532 [Microbotryum saponariae]SDA06021.1 BZ3501_MvSof-1269-A2-R1_Chr10-1g02133 [Microbotryum saponariae]
MQDPSLYDARHPWDDVSSIGVPCVASTPRWSTKEQGLASSIVSLPESYGSSGTSAQASTAASSPPPNPGPSSGDHSSTGTSSASSSSASSSSDDARAFEWPPLRDYFIKSMDDSEAERSRTGPSGMPEITWESGKPSLRVKRLIVDECVRPVQRTRGRFITYRDPVHFGRLDFSDEMPGAALLTREAFEAGGANAISANRSSHCEQHDAPQDWSPVAVVGDIMVRGQVPNVGGDKEALHERFEGYIRALASNPIRSHAFGFILVESTLVIFLCTHSGLLFSPDIECTEANGYLSTFFARLLSLTDSELGIVASLSAYPFAFAGLPLRVPRYRKHLASVPTFSRVEVVEQLCRSTFWDGRCTSAYRVRATRGGGEKEASTSTQEYAMTVSFVAAPRSDEHDRIRLSIATASPEEREGLTNIVDVYRESEFTVVPKFLGGGGGLPRGFRFTPRAMEVAFHEQCFDPIWVIDSTVSLARVILGVAKGLRNLYRMHILHRDVSAGNILVAPDGQGVLIDYDLAIYIKDDGPAPAERYRRAGTLAFLARQRFPPLGGVGPPLPHQPWHDIESLAYVILYLIFSRPEGPNGPKAMIPTTRILWSGWEDPGSFPAESKMVLFRSHYGLQKTLQPYTSYWTGVFDLLGIVMHFCGLDHPRSRNLRQREEAEVKAPWEQGKLSHDGLISDLAALVDRP